MTDNLKQELQSALERLINNKPVHLKINSALTAANVIRETGRLTDQVKLSRFPSIQARIKEEKARLKAKRKKQELKARTSRRSISEQLLDAKSQRDSLYSIIDSQNDYILSLLHEIEMLKSNVSELTSRE